MSRRQILLCFFVCGLVLFATFQTWYADLGVGPPGMGADLEQGQVPFEVPVGDTQALYEYRWLADHQVDSIDEARGGLPKTGATKINKEFSLLTGNCVFGNVREQYSKPSCKRNTTGKDKKMIVLEGDATFELLKQGASIMRYGDGELRLMDGVTDINHGMEVNSKELTFWLERIAALGGKAAPGFPCVGLLGIMDKSSTRFQKHISWTHGNSAERYKSVMRKCFPAGRYCSASITRPDHLAAWSTEQLVAAWSEVFADKVVLYIRPKGQFSDHHEQLFGKSIRVISPDFVSQPRRTFSEFADIMKAIYDVLDKEHVDITALSLGPTATIVAGELACQGLQSIDFGSFSARR